MTKLKSTALGILVLVVAVPIYMYGKHRMATPAGAACDSSTTCRGNSMLASGMCFSDGDASYCTHECSATDDCSDGMACQPVDGTWTESTTQGNHATQTRTSQGTKNVCVRP
jgi:hypothetical protein